MEFTKTLTSYVKVFLFYIKVYNYMKDYTANISNIIYIYIKHYIKVFYNGILTVCYFHLIAKARVSSFLFAQA